MTEEVTQEAQEVAPIEQTHEEIAEAIAQDNPDQSNDGSTEVEESLEEVDKEEDFENVALEELPLPESKLKSKKDYILARKEKQLDRERKEKEHLKRQLESMQSPQNMRPNMGAQIPPPFQPPRREDFMDEDEYIDARLEYKLAVGAQNIHVQQMQKQHVEAQQKTAKKYQDVFEKGNNKYEDFEEVVGPIFDPYGDFPSNPMMGEAIAESPFGDDIFYFLAKYPKQAREIAQLSPVQAIKKITEIESRFKQKKQNQPKANGMKIIEPLGNPKATVTGKKLEDMSKEEIDRMSSADFAKIWSERKKSNMHKHF